MGLERALQVLRAPVITEKTTTLAGYNVVCFRIDKSTTKVDVREAVELLYGVKVLTVNTLILKGKSKNFRGIRGKRSDIKKAYVRSSELIDVTAPLRAVQHQAAE